MFSILNAYLIFNIKQHLNIRNQFANYLTMFGKFIFVLFKSLYFLKSRKTHWRSKTFRLCQELYCVVKVAIILFKSPLCGSSIFVLALMRLVSAKFLLKSFIAYTDEI